jgi:hypothetical protein
LGINGPVGGAFLRSAGCVLLAVLVGCGGPIQRDELKRGIETLASDAADGSALARGVAKDRMRSTFVRVHARELSDDADHEAEKLHDAQANSPVAEKKQKAVVIAQRISDALGALRVAPADVSGARTAERQLDGLARAANDLANSL